MLSLVSIALVSSLWISLAWVAKISFKCFYIHGVNVFPQGDVNLEKKEICHKARAAASEEQFHTTNSLSRSTEHHHCWFETAECVHDCLRSMSDSLGITVKVLEVKYYWTFCMYQAFVPDSFTISICGWKFIKIWYRLNIWGKLQKWQWCCVNLVSYYFWECVCSKYRWYINIQAIRNVLSEKHSKVFKLCRRKIFLLR